ncbi:6367_t:CDS:2, partial [Ambispora leptoticha]
MSRQEIKFLKTHKRVHSSHDIFTLFSPEIIVHILGQLTPSNIFAVALVNKHLCEYTRDNYLWHLVCLHQFGDSFVKEIITNLKNSSNQIQCNWKQICIEQYRKPAFLADKCEITSFCYEESGIVNTHTRDAYIVNYEKSKCGKTVLIPSQDERLHFLNLSTVLKNVPAGTYRVIWRMCVHHLSVLKGTRFITRKPKFVPKKYVYQPKYYDYSENTLEKKFVDYQLPFQLEIPSFNNKTQNCNVYVAFECTAGMPLFAGKL